MKEEKKSGHGGYREGAGRKAPVKLHPKTVRLSDEQIEFLTDLGGGELSAGIRKLVNEKLGEGSV